MREICVVNGRPAVIPCSLDEDNDEYIDSRGGFIARDNCDKKDDGKLLRIFFIWYLFDILFLFDILSELSRMSVILEKFLYTFSYFF